jgi:hypothetical protein
MNHRRAFLAAGLVAALPAGAAARRKLTVAAFALLDEVAKAATPRNAYVTLGPKAAGWLGFDFPLFSVLPSRRHRRGRLHRAAGHRPGTARVRALGPCRHQAGVETDCGAPQMQAEAG